MSPLPLCGALPQPMPPQGVILAAGAGTRLRPLTETVPKPLVRFFGRALLDWSVLKLIEAKVERVAVNAHHLASDVANHVDGLRSRYPGIEFYLSEEPGLLGTGGALRRLSDAGWFVQGPTWVLNSDAIYASPLAPLLRRYSPGRSVLMVTREPEHEGLRRLRCAPDGTLLGIVEPSAPEAYAFCGVTLADETLLRMLPEGPSCLLRQGLLPRGLAPPAELCEVRGFFADTGTPELLADAHRRGLGWVSSLDEA